MLKFHFKVVYFGFLPYTCKVLPYKCKVNSNISKKQAILLLFYVFYLKSLIVSESINVKNLRKRLNLSQAEFAKLLGVTQKTVSNWEMGKVIPDSKIGMLQNISNNAIVGSIISGNNCNNDNRQFYSDSPDVLRKQIEDLERTIAERERLLAEKEERIKEKDSQIKEKDSQIKTLLSILNKQ